MSTITRSHAGVPVESPDFHKGGAFVASVVAAVAKLGAAVLGKLARPDWRALSAKQFSEWQAIFKRPAKGKPRLKKLLTQPSVFE